MKNNSIPDFPLDTTTLNSTEIPELDTQTANQFLNNVLEACDMEPRHFFEVAKGRMKFKCLKISHAGGCISCTCEKPCSNAKYGRTVHLVLKDNPRLFNNPPRSSKEWKLEYNARTSAERSNKREKLDFKLEDGRHRSTKMWYCRLYHILMLQHLDAWDLPSESPLRKLILDVA